MGTGLQAATQCEPPLNIHVRDGILQPHIHRSWGRNISITLTPSSRPKTQILTVIWFRKDFKESVEASMFQAEKVWTCCFLLQEEKLLLTLWIARHFVIECSSSHRIQWKKPYLQNSISMVDSLISSSSNDPHLSSIASPFRITNSSSWTTHHFTSSKNPLAEPPPQKK